MSDVAIAVVGSANVDVICGVERLPDRGETVRAGSLALAPGGKGANQAVAARRLGAAVRLVAAIGDDALGRQLRAWLAAEGLGEDGIAVLPEATTGVATIAVEPDGANRILYGPGANDGLDAGLVAAALAEERIDCMLGGFEVGDAALLAGARLARERGATTILNPSPPRELSADLVAAFDWFVVNESEFSSLRGRQPTDEALVAAGAEWGCGVVATVGGAGACLATGGQLVRRAAPVVPVRDTTGAGDAFAAAFGCALAAGGTAERALELAIAAGSLSVGRAGAQASFPGLDAVIEAAAWN
jgi:ribokinase